MIPCFLNRGKVFLFLLALDQDLAERAQLGGCPHCLAPLHQAHYYRKPRGCPWELDEECSRRFSFCCYHCRKRLTPPSFRFFGRRVYFGAIFLLASALFGGGSPRRRRRLHIFCGADDRTLRRWHTWWTESFAASPFWRGLSARYSFPRGASFGLPRLLFPRVGGPSSLETMVRVLRMLLPLTSGAGGRKSTLVHGRKIRAEDANLRGLASPVSWMESGNPLTINFEGSKTS